MTANAIRVLAPYWYAPARTWVFDDPAAGLRREPFVVGVPAMIDALVAGLPDARRGFRMLFSAEPFPGHSRTLTRLREESGGCWYGDGEREGWLCPALFRYFPAPPEKIYVAAEPVS